MKCGPAVATKLWNEGHQGGGGTGEGGQSAGQVIDKKVEITEDSNREKRNNVNQEAVGTWRRT